MTEAIPANAAVLVSLPTENTTVLDSSFEFHGNQVDAWQVPLISLRGNCSGVALTLQDEVWNVTEQNLTTTTSDGANMERSLLSVITLSRWDRHGRIQIHNSTFHVVAVVQRFSTAVSTLPHPWMGVALLLWMPPGGLFPTAASYFGELGMLAEDLIVVLRNVSVRLYGSVQVEKRVVVGFVNSVYAGFDIRRVELISTNVTVDFGDWLPAGATTTWMSHAFFFLHCTRHELFVACRRGPVFCNL